MQKSLFTLAELAKKTDLVCFSHLRWDSAMQRHQHLLNRFANHARIFYIEEPVIGDFEKGFLDVTVKDKNLWIVVPSFPKDLSERQMVELQQELLKIFFQVCTIRHYIFLYYNPLALEFSRRFTPLMIIYDYMDNKGQFKDNILENELISKANLVFYNRASKAKGWPAGDRISISG